MPTLKRHSEPKERKRDDFRWLYQSSRWHRYSKGYLKLHRLCVICLKEGRTEVARVTDHRIPVTQGGDIWNPENHQPLCFSCHNRKTFHENRKQMATINVVYGPPCSGKSTLINNRMRFGDYILDIDEIAKCFLRSSTNDHRIRTEHQIKELLDIRDSVLNSLVSKNVTVWVPTTSLEAFIFKNIKFNKIDNIKTKEECLRYLENSDRINKDHHTKAIEGWFVKQ